MKNALNYLTNPRKMIIAVDFDGTIADQVYPDPGIGNVKSVFFTLFEKRVSIPVPVILNYWRRKGDKIILWTCRHDTNLLDKAVEWCSYFNLQFDAINDNLPEMIEDLNYNPRKLMADWFIDDRACFDINNVSSWNQNHWNLKEGATFYENLFFKK